MGSATAQHLKKVTFRENVLPASYSDANHKRHL